MREQQETAAIIRATLDNKLEEENGKCFMLCFSFVLC